jgi:uncharacterized membrane protein
MFHALRRVNRQLMWLNLLFLLLVTFLPFTTSLLSVETGSRIAVMIYGANLATISLILFSIWFYITRVAKLADPKLSVEVRRDVDQRILSMPLLAIASIAFFVLQRARQSLRVLPDHRALSSRAPP